MVAPVFAELEKIGGARMVRSVMPGSPVVHFGVSLAVGCVADPPARPGLTALVLAAVVDRGLRDGLARLGATPRITWTADGGTLACACESGDVAAIVEMLARRLRAPVLDAAGLSAAVARAEAAAAIAAGDPRRVAMRALDGLIFGEDGARAHRGVAARGGLVGLTAEELAAHADKFVGPTRMMWISTGEADLRPAIAAAWAGWAPDTSRNFEFALEVTRRTSIVLVDRPGADQVVIATGRRGLPATDADCVLAARAMRILRSAVHERLRGDRGLSYYTEAGHDDGHPGRLRLVTQVDADAAGEALRVVLWGLEHVQELVVAQKWMDDQDTYDALEQVYVQDSGEGRIAAASRSHRLELPLNAPPARARPVGRLMRVIDELLRPANWQVVCVGDQRKVLAQLERFGAVAVREVSSRQAHPR